MIDVESLIYEVEVNPRLWDVRVDSYKDRDIEIALNWSNNK